MVDSNFIKSFLPFLGRCKGKQKRADNTSNSVCKLCAFHLISQFANFKIINEMLLDG